MSKDFFFLDEYGQFKINLYHGTSSLFLESIIQSGLGGKNIVKDWRIFDLSREVLELAYKHLFKKNAIDLNFDGFSKMVEQKAGTFNFQHGDVYVSCSELDSVRYAISNPFGSEILSNTIYYLKLLLAQNIAKVKNDLLKKYPEVNILLEKRPSPILIEAKNVNMSSLLTESGEDPLNSISSSLLEFIKEYPKEGFSQLNFRSKRPIEKENLRFFQINVLRDHIAFPEYHLDELKTS